MKGYHEYEVVEISFPMACGDLDDAIDGFNTLLMQGYMAHPDDFNSPEMQRQVRATTYLMSVVRRQFADKVQEMHAQTD